MRNDDASHPAGDTERAAALRKSRNLMIASIIVAICGTIPMVLFMADLVTNGGPPRFPLVQTLAMIGGVMVAGILNVLALHAAGTSVLDLLSRRGTPPRSHNHHRPPGE